MLRSIRTEAGHDGPCELIPTNVQHRAAVIVTKSLKRGGVLDQP